ncbi:MAG: LuxR C-terminal-related transcriptional regulator [Nostocaceae cyanobacterium]|nr:LuxR C-terminal-related transcriptional regulator [Nostocaceae cyanobacterium]
MANSLHTLLHGIASARDERSLRMRFIDGVGEHFDAQQWGICLFDEQSGIAQIDDHSVSGGDTFVKHYEAVGRKLDPILDYVVKRHAPAHEQLVLPPGEWKQCEFYKLCGSHYNHEHMMMGPIVGGGRLIGGVYFARVGDTPAFNDENLADLSALCLHMSASLAQLQPRDTKIISPLVTRLTPRETQIAELVAKGLTNAEIGKQLWITQNTVKQALKRMFRKLEVSARTEMVAKLQDILS